jgi:hypothetical protein
VHASLDNTPGAMPLAAFIPVRRAALLVGLGRSREAMPLIAASIKRADGGELPKGMSSNLRRTALRFRAAAEAAAGDAAAAQQTASLLEMDAAERKDDVNAQSGMHYALGMAAVAKRDYGAAKAHFARCLARDWACRFELSVAADKAGDAAAADAARQAILKLYVRDPVYVFYRSRLEAKSKTS